MSVVNLNLETQKLYIEPGDPIPEFYPRPRAIRVTPIYTDPYLAESDPYDSEPYRQHRRSGSYGHSLSRPESYEHEQNGPRPHRSSSSRHEGRLRRYNRSEERRRYESPRRYDGHRYSEYQHSEGSPVPHEQYEPHGYGQEHAPPIPHGGAGRGVGQGGHYPPSASHGAVPGLGRGSQHVPSASHGTGQGLGRGGAHAPSTSHAYGQGHGGGSNYAPSQTSYLDDYGPVSGSMPAKHSNNPLKMMHDQFVSDVQRYLKILPPAPDFTYSKCTGKKKAVCIGINYEGQKDELRGCANDARSMRDFLIQRYGFKIQDIMMLVDDDGKSIKPTRTEMFKAMRWLVQGAHAHDSLFFHYSGHGGQKPDDTGKELDGQDEVIFPLDYDDAGDIVDDELFKELVAPLPPGCRLTAVFDSCHSGTVLDLPYLHSAHGRLRGISHISLRCRKRGKAPSADVISFAACRDDEQSADTFHGGVAAGAMSYALIKSLRTNPHQTYEVLLRHLREILVPKYNQKAQLSGTHPVDLQRQFVL